ncbi:hypothetical protein GGI06_000330 [Coemansia sp. S85]|nr:hypothetical protein GGI06_000330 [Coemansia sp. S85]
MSGTSSDATMTIGQAATSGPAASGVDGGLKLEWAMWDIDGAMAVMPLSAVSADNSDSADTFPIGMAIDYTSKRDLPPVLDDGDRVKPVPVLWVLNTDACLLGYRVCNTYEMKRGSRCPLMVDEVKQLPGAASAEPTPSRDVVEPAKATPFGSAKAFGGVFGSTVSSGSTGAFGSTVSSGSTGAFGAFGKSGTTASAFKPPTALGVIGQPVFGGAAKGSAATTTTAFGGFGSATLGAGKSIFDAPSSGSSIFDSGDKAKTASPFGSAFAASPFGASKSTTTTQPLSVVGGFNLPQAKDASAKPGDKDSARALFGSAPKSPLGFSTGGQTLNLFDSAKKPPPSFASAASTKPADKERLEDEKRKEDEKREDERRKEAALALEAARVLEAERRNEQARLDALQREMEEKSQALIDQQYIATCNSFDRDLKALASSIKETESAIACVRSASLPPIPLNAAIQSQAAIGDGSGPFAIDDTDSWNRIADVLLEALHVSHDELRISQKSVAKQQSGHIKTETKREEISRILSSAASALSSPHAALDGGLNPQQRDSLRRLKGNCALIGTRATEAEQALQSEANRIESETTNLRPSLRAPTSESFQKTLLQCSHVSHENNKALDGLFRLLDSLETGVSAKLSSRRERKATLPPAPASSSTVVSTGLPLRTAAAGVPWSPDALPLNTSSFGRRNGGFGLSAEDLVVHDGSADATPAALGHPRQSILSNKASAIGSNPNFPHTRVRELVPRSSKVNRKASLVPDSESTPLGQDIGDGASLASLSVFSGAAAYIQAREQRLLVKNRLASSDRTALLIHSPDLTASRAYKLGSLYSSIVAEPVPMPNLERYVQAFGKLKLEEPAITPVSEPEEQQTQSTPTLASSVPPAEPTSPLGPEAVKWRCSICDLLSADSAVTCCVCDAPRPGTLPVRSAPPPATFSGFKPSGGLSIAGLAPASGPPASSASAPTATSRMPFSSFVPPAGASAATALSGFKPSGGLLLTQLPTSSSGPGPSFGATAKQAPLFNAFVPPSGMASFAPGTGTAAQINSPVAAGDEGEKWTCHLCELKNAPRDTVCAICEEPRPGQGVSAPAFDPADPNAGDSSSEAEIDSLDDGHSVPSDGEESEDSGSEDGHGYSGDEGDYSDDSIDVAERDLVSDEESERDLASNEESEHDLASNEESEHDLASNEELDRDLDVPKSDLDASSAHIPGFGASASTDARHATDSDDLEETNLAAHPSLSYADAAKVALADHSSEALVPEAPDHPDSVDEAPVDLEPATPELTQLDEHEPNHDHDHDSDGFVHVSQLESALQSKADVSQVEGDDGVLSVAASEVSLDTPADTALSTGEHVSNIASDIDDANQDQGEAFDTESKILAAVSDELDRGIAEEPAPVSLVQPQPIEAEPSAPHSLIDAHLVRFLSGPSIALVVDQALSSHARIPEPTAAVEEAGVAAATASDGRVAPEPVDADADEAPTLSPATTSQPGHPDVPLGPATDAHSTPPSQALVEQQDEAAPAFSLDDLAVGIECALGDRSAANDFPSEPVQSDDIPEIGSPESLADQASEDNVATAPTQLPAMSESGAKSFFKAGRLGSFGRSTGAAIPATTPGQAVPPSSSSALPNAFSAAVIAPTLEFGKKLDRPAFGVASMSSFGASSQAGQQQSATKTSGSFASMGKLGTGFSSRASSSIDPFAAYKGAGSFLGSPTTDAPAGSSAKSTPPPNLDDALARMSGDDASPRQNPKAISKPAAPPSSSKNVDPILSIIHGSDSEADKDDIDYDSE